MNSEDRYKKIRNKIRGFSTKSIVNIALSRIRDYESSLENNEYNLPWILFPFLKMAFIYAEENLNYKDITEEEFDILYTHLVTIENDYKSILLNNDGLHAYLHAMSSQQFWVQQKLSSNDLSRFNFLFSNDSSLIGKQFYSTYGINISLFIEMILATHIIFQSHHRYNEINLLEHLCKFNFNKLESRLFLEIISKTPKELKKHLKKTPVKSWLLQFGEITPLYEYPLLCNGNTYSSYGILIFNKSIPFILYEFAKKDGEDTIRELANSFEEYINRLLKSSGTEFLNEQEIAKLYQGKKTDFIVTEKDTTIMIEAKSVRLRPIEIANPTPKNILKALKDNVIKAFFQGHELSNNILKVKKHNFILVIVTYDNVSAGPFSYFYEKNLQEYCEKQFKSGKKVRGPLQIDNIVLININDFEKLCMLRKRNGNFIDELSTIIDNGQKRLPLTHQLNPDSSDILRFNKDQFDVLMNKLQRRVKNSYVSSTTT